ncbi:MAG TPA: hypothetical protein VEY71_08490 [Chitinophagales bacterium]|nr:hypothetical protein [Chitinophagales bacterium]
MERKPMKITFFKSFEEMNEHDIKQMASRSAIDALKNAVELTLRVYGVTREMLNQQPKPRTVTIVSRS